MSRRGPHITAPFTARSSRGATLMVPADAADYRGAATWRTPINPPTNYRGSNQRRPSRMSTLLPAATPRGLRTPFGSLKPHDNLNGSSTPRRGLAGDYRSDDPVSLRLDPAALSDFGGFTPEPPMFRLAGGIWAGDAHLTAPPAPPATLRLDIGNRRHIWMPSPKIRGGLYGGHQTPRESPRASAMQLRPPQPPCLPTLDTVRLPGLKLPPTAAIPSMAPMSYMEWIVDGWDTNRDGYVDDGELAKGESNTGPLHRLAGNHRGGDGGNVPSNAPTPGYEAASTY